MCKDNSDLRWAIKLVEDGAEIIELSAEFFRSEHARSMPSDVIETFEAHVRDCRRLRRVVSKLRRVYEKQPLHQN